MAVDFCQESSISGVKVMVSWPEPSRLSGDGVVFQCGGQVEAARGEVVQEGGRTHELEFMNLLHYQRCVA